MKNKLRKIHKLTPEIIEWIKEEAAKLPKFVKMKDGKPVLQALPTGKANIIDPETNEIVGQREVQLATPVLINHNLNMQGDYQTHGKEGVENYIAEAHRLALKYKDDGYFKQLNN